MDAVTRVGAKMKQCHSGLDVTTPLEGKLSQLSLFCPDEQTSLLLLLLQGTYLAVEVVMVQCPELTGDLGDTREGL